MYHSIVKTFPNTSNMWCVIFTGEFYINTAVIEYIKNFVSVLYRHYPKKTEMRLKHEVNDELDDPKGA